MTLDQLPDHWKRWILEHTRGRDFPGELGAGDFQPDRVVRLEFPDGSTSVFRSAFAVSDEEHSELAVFTEHCGYHVFPAGGLTYSEYSDWMNPRRMAEEAAWTVRDLRALLVGRSDATLVAVSPTSPGELPGLVTLSRSAASPGVLFIEKAIPETAQLRLLRAVDDGDPDAASAALAAGANPSAPDPRSPLLDGETPLHLAVDQPDVLKVLLDHEAEVDRRSLSGWTALMRACSAGNLEAVRVLLKAGADVHCVNDEGYTAYDRTPGTNHELLEVLESYGAKTGDQS